MLARMTVQRLGQTVRVWLLVVLVLLMRPRLAMALLGAAGGLFVSREGAKWGGLLRKAGLLLTRRQAVLG